MLHFFRFRSIPAHHSYRHDIPSRDACTWFIEHRLSKHMHYTEYDLTMSVDKLQYSKEAQQEKYTETGADRESKRG